MLATIPVDLIDIGTRLRSISEAQVETLMNSIAEVGLLNPITAHASKVIRNGIAVDGYGIVAGAHRLEAVRRLGLVEIDANIVELGELHRQLAEVDENLAGTSLTPAERARFTQRRKDIYIALYPETRATKDGGEGRHKETRRQLGDELAPRFTADTAERTGQSERTIQRDAARGSAIPDDVLAKIRGTHLDKGVYLDALKHLSPEQQRKKVREDLKPPEPRSRKALAEAREKRIQAFVRAWERLATPEEQEEALSRIDRPVFDRGRTGRAA